jgi:aminoglycoside 6'-N-acetyltransferase
MTATDQIQFRRMTADDLDLFVEWQSNAHVREWWGADQSDDDPNIDDPRVARWIISYTNRPFAYMQDYSVHDWVDHHFFHLPHGSRGIDQFIGEPDMLGAGHGSAFIAIRMQALFEDGTPVIATDPHPENARAIAVYKKLGFREAGPPQSTPWGLILPMLARR